MKLMTVVLTLAVAAGAASAQYLETTIPLPQEPEAVAWNPANNHVYCAVGYPDAFGAVIVIDGATNAILDTLMLPGQMPGELCVDATHNRIYCANSSWYPLDDSVVTVIDGATDSIVANIQVGSIPKAMCYSPVGNKLYCASQGQGAAFVIDCDVDTVLGTIPTRNAPYSCVYVPELDKAYFACRGFYGRADFAVTIIDCAADTVRRNLGVGTFPTAICYNRTDQKVYTADNFTFDVSIIDATQDTVEFTLAVDSSPGALLWNPNTDRVYVGDDYTNVFTIIDGPTNGRHGTMMLAGPVWEMALDSAANKLYITNYLNDKVTVLDGATELIIATITVDSGPRCIAQNAVNSRVYVGCREARSLAVIRDGAGAVEESRPSAVGSQPTATVVASGVKRGASSVLYDAQGRRVSRPGPGVYFVREQVAGCSEQYRMRKVVVAR
jgi:YVTN family beta-propeller protein